MNDAALNISIKMEPIDCPSCAATYAINGAYVDLRRKDGKGWHCPYCASITSFHNNCENSKLKKQLADEQAIKNRLLADANNLRAEVAAARVAAEKLKKRVVNGVCPCCTRTFSNVAQHMKEKHPEFTENKPAAKSPKSKGAYAKQRLAEIAKGKP